MGSVPHAAGGIAPAGETSARAVRAAVAVARAHGLRVTDPVILKDGSNVLVHMWPSAVVARVATTTALARPGVAAWLAREIAMATHLAAAGAPAVPPADELPPGPHEEDGMAIVFLRHVPHDPDAEVDPAVAGRLLAAIHDALDTYSGSLPLLDPPLGEVERVLDVLATAGALSPQDVSALRDDHERVAGEVRACRAPIRPLHGDAHPGNILVTERGPVWADFEDCCAGPVHWDLACLARSAGRAGPRVLAAYGPAAPPMDELEPFMEARRLQALVWWGLAALRFPHRRPAFEERLEDWRGGR